MPQIDRRLEGTDKVAGRTVVHSLSGNERNHLFFNRQGTTFEDVSLVSGIDNPADSRGFVTLDFDHDGQLDIALVNANRPLLNLYHNQIDRVQRKPNHSVAIQFEGGNHSAQAAEKLNCRDGFGALVIAQVGDAMLHREFRCGEGYGTQNSSTLIIGIGQAPQVDDLVVQWPSGKVSKLGAVRSGTLVKVFEVATDKAPQGFLGSDYRPISIDLAALARRQAEERIGSLQFLPGPLIATSPIVESPTRTRLYVTTATWCTACIEHLPHLRDLAQEFAGQLEIVGLPVDPEDTAEKLLPYFQRIKPPYPLVTQLTSTQRDQIEQVFAGKLPTQAVPAAFLTDAAGHVLFVGAGVPSRSDLLPHLQQQQDE